MNMQHTAVKSAPAVSAQASSVRRHGGAHHTHDTPITAVPAPAAGGGETLSKLIVSRMAAPSTVLIDSVADQMGKDESIFAVGVIDDHGKPAGMVVRTDLFGVLGKPFCRDAFSRKPLARIMKRAEAFSESAKILEVLEYIKDDLKKHNNTFYLATDAAGRYSGIFSTRSMLGYLSDITQKDLYLAKKVQQSVVKEETHIVRDTCEFYAYTNMAKDVGGDFYYINNYAENRWIAAICDVSGKGVGASLVSTALGGMFAAYDFRQGIKSFIQRVNQYFIDTFYMEKFATGIIVDYNVVTGDAVICDMGHKYILLARGEKAHRVQTTNDNLPIGIIPEADIKFNRYRMQPGESLVLMTDGLTEQRNIRGDEYRYARFSRIIGRYRSDGLKAVAKETIADLKEFRGIRPQDDDVTMLFISRTNPPASAAH